MKILIFLISIFQFSFAAATDIGADIGLYREWRFTQFIFEGRRYEAPNPNLYLSLTFFPDGTDSLYWKRSDENSFCQRKASFKYADNWLEQKVIELNPQNGSQCAQDPDMQLGKQTKNKLLVFPQEVHLYLELNGKDFIYVLTPTSAYKNDLLF